MNIPDTDDPRMEAIVFMAIFVLMLINFVVLILEPIK